ncbi:MAG TPA: 30S ribosomal protein S6, partial [Dongiaceae bacterium]
ENVFIARQDISAAQADTLAETFTNVITENGGKVTKKENWGLRNIAYRIKKNRKGHYVLLNIDAPPAAVQEMERQMRISEDILRYLTTRVEELEEGPSAMLRRSRDDDDRGPREGGRRFGRDDDRGPRGDRPRFRDEDRGPREERAPREEAAPAAAPAGNGGEA